MMTGRALRSFAQRHIQFFRFKGGQDEKTVTILKNIAAETAAALLESWDLIDRLPEIHRINPTRLPIMRDDGRVDLLKPGYFAEQGIYTVDAGIEYDETMTREQAKALLDDRLKDFPFPDERSKAVAVAAMFTMFCAGLLNKRSLRPGFIYRGNAPGAGKTLLCKFAIITIAGSCAVRTMPRRDETRKVLDSLAIEASIYILFDNVRGKIASEDIEAFITSPQWNGRYLGESKPFCVDNVATMFLTGNQSSTSPDIADRCLFVELFVEEADNRDRVIPRLIDDNFLADNKQRAEMLSAMWALVRSWDGIGRPRGPTIMPRFEQWSQIVAGIVYASGYGDPLARAVIPGAGDVELRDMYALIALLAPDEVGTQEPWEFSHIIEQIKEKGLFEDAEAWVGRQQKDIWEKDGSLSTAGRSFFGKMLASYHERLFRSDDGRRLRLVVQGKGNSRRYVVAREA